MLEISIILVIIICTLLVIIRIMHLKNVLKEDTIKEQAKSIEQIRNAKLASDKVITQSIKNAERRKTENEEYVKNLDKMIDEADEGNRMHLEDLNKW